MRRLFPIPAWLPGKIALRISLLSWLVTLLALTIFVTAIIPEQKRDLLEALDSKARGVSSSLQEVTAGAAISEDYSSVVDQCIQVLAGDQAIDYLVITKNDGVSVIVERGGWRMAQLNSFWRPKVREITSGIQVVPVFQRRVFHFSRPFDYSAIQWGWIHVGLSLSSYDRSVARVYGRTAFLAILCVAISLLASVLYARQLVKPILGLQSVVRQVAEGDLTARAASQEQDEIGSLASSFNTMADSILQRNRILESIRFAGQQFLSTTDWRAVVPEMLSRLGAALRASRGAVFENHEFPGGKRRTILRYSWESPEFAGASDEEYSRRLRSEGVELGDLADQLRRGEIVHMDYRRRKATDGLEVPGRPPVSVLTPIHVGSEWFGFLGFDDCRNRREWSEAELDALRTAAGMLGATIARQQAQEAAVEAKESLERRVVDRTRELQDQVNAKEQARAQLAEAQQRLMELSRVSGMAEVATGVLHNVGNVLNSVNVGADLVESRIRELRVDQMVSAIEMLMQHRADLAEFLGADPAGRRVLPYLEKLGRHLQKERSGILEELRLSRDHVDHIKQIVATQQKYARVSGLIEEISLAQLVDDSLRMAHASFQRHKVRVEREYEDLSPAPIDKHKVLQILLNLLQNAKQAIKEADPADRVVHVRLRRASQTRVRIEVQDSGIGLSPESLTRVFAHGFTTKKDGHGFGLHSGALAARQMGGALWAESEGLGRGATFVLELPLALNRARQRGVA
jgi:signal transduction histidine kinase